MADYVKGLFGFQQPPASPGSDDDFADFAAAPDPSPAFVSPIPDPVTVAPGTLPTGQRLIPYTKWYRVWERTQPKDFVTEAVILPFILVICGLHIWGRRTNKSKAKAWIAAHQPVLEKEYALVGFGGRQQSHNSTDLSLDEAIDPETVLKEKTAQEYVTYATGRQNVAFLDVKVSLFKRYNPATLLVEFILSFIFDTMRAPTERMEATAYAFDGRENDLVPAKSQEQLDAIQAQGKAKSSMYDAFVWAVVHKEHMRTLRDDRYDVSLTGTRDNVKLPVFATVMSESAEITEQLLTPDLIKAVEDAGDLFEYLVVTDQPIDKPLKLDETKPRKRVSLSLKIPSGSDSSSYKSTLPIFSHYLRLPDQLASQAHFRPEVRRKLNATREEEQRKLVRADEEEKAEERRFESEKAKREIRDKRLTSMTAAQQKKFLEKEKEKMGRKDQKKLQKKG